MGYPLDDVPSPDRRRALPRLPAVFIATRLIVVLTAAMVERGPRSPPDVVRLLAGNFPDSGLLGE